MQLDEARYLSLATFRKSGARVDTPVWFGADGDYYYVVSNNQAGKVKRLRNSSLCAIAPCTLTGTVTGAWQDSTAELLDDPAAIALAHRALQAKYGWQMRLLDTGAWLGGRIRQRSYIRIQRP